MIEIKRIEIDTRIMDKWISMCNSSVDRAIGSMAFQVEGIAKILAPFDTHALQNSINTQKMNIGQYRVQDGVEYGIYQELGTSKMAAHPFMIPALEDVRDKIAEMVKKELEKI